MESSDREVGIADTPEDLKDGVRGSGDEEDKVGLGAYDHFSGWQRGGSRPSNGLERNPKIIESA
jgi:hypothetical protein